MSAGKCGACGRPGHYRKTCGAVSNARRDVTKQRRLQLRRREDGQCVDCDAPAKMGIRCDYHAGYYAATTKWMKRMAKYPQILRAILTMESAGAPEKEKPTR